MMAQSIAVKPALQAKTCSTCPHFDNFHEPNRRGWCELFNRQAREHHQVTDDCIHSSTSEWNKPNQVRRFLASKLVISHELEDNLALFPDVNFEELEAFPTEVVELDRDGYPMMETAPTGYFSPNFTTSPGELF